MPKNTNMTSELLWLNCNLRVRKHPLSRSSSSNSESSEMWRKCAKHHQERFYIWFSLSSSIQIQILTQSTLLFLNILPEKRKHFLILSSSLSRYSSAPKTKRIFEMLWCVIEIIQLIHFYPLFKITWMEPETCFG